METLLETDPPGSTRSVGSARPAKPASPGPDQKIWLDLLVEDLARGDAGATNLLCNHMAARVPGLAQSVAGQRGWADLGEMLARVAARRLWARLACREYHPLPWKDPVSGRASYRCLNDYQSVIVNGSSLKLLEVFRI